MRPSPSIGALLFPPHRLRCTSVQRHRRRRVRIEHVNVLVTATCPSVRSSRKRYPLSWAQISPVICNNLGTCPTQAASLFSLDFWHIIKREDYDNQMRSMWRVWMGICTLCSKKSDAKIQITITTTHLMRINYHLSSFNYRLFGTNVANFYEIHHTVSEQQLF